MKKIQILNIQLKIKKISAPNNANITKIIIYC